MQVAKAGTAGLAESQLFNGLSRRVNFKKPRDSNQYGTVIVATGPKLASSDPIPTYFPVTNL